MKPVIRKVPTFFTQEKVKTQNQSKITHTLFLI